MKVVVDTNRIIASLIRDGLSRRLLLGSNLDFYSPDYALTEIRRHGREVIEKAGISENELEILLSIIFEGITVVPKEEYAYFMECSKDLVGDVGDVPFIALALAINAECIWTDDKDFQKQKRIRVYSTKEMCENSKTKG